MMRLKWTLPLAFGKALPDHIIIPVDSDPSEQRSKMNLSGYQEVATSNRRRGRAGIKVEGEISVASNLTVSYV
jgi:hypothetical protein